MFDVDTPRRILMASDLSARSDRALARAAVLARAWNAELLVAHVVHAAQIAQRDRLTSHVPSWHRPRSWALVLESELTADLAAEGIAARSRVIVGATGEALQQAVIDESAGLVVLGLAKDERLDRIQLGSTVDTLVRRSRVPVLNVRRRARDGYRRVAVATDFSPPSLHALRLAAAWFSGAHVTLFHAYTAPGSTVASGVASGDYWRATAAQLCASHLAEAGLPASVPIECVVEQGHPQALLADYVSCVGVDLVVMGSQGRSGLARALLGSTAENLLHTLDCDTLVVRAG